MNFTIHVGLDESNLITIGKLTSKASFLALESSHLGLHQGRTEFNKFVINAVTVQLQA